MQTTQLRAPLFLARSNTGSVAENGRVESYDQRKSKILGVAQIVIGVIAIVCDGVSIKFANSSEIHDISINRYGIWNGVLFITAGAVGVFSGIKKTTCWIIAYMVMCIISASVSINLLFFGIAGSFKTAGQLANYELLNNCKSNSSDYINYQDDHDENRTSIITTRLPCAAEMGKFKLVIAMQSTMAIMAVLNALVAIIGSALCCRSVCCCTTNRNSDGITLIQLSQSDVKNIGSPRLISFLEKGMSSQLTPNPAFQEEPTYEELRPTSTPLQINYLPAYSSRRGRKTTKNLAVYGNTR